MGGTNTLFAFHTQYERNYKWSPPDILPRKQSERLAPSRLADVQLA